MSITSSATTPSAPPDPQQAADRLESRNILLLAIYQVMLRLAWVFKTESVVIPAFLHAISGQAWMQGWLPMLNRFGQSLPPLIYADHLRDMPLKKMSLVRTTALMGGLFLILAGLIWLVPRREFWWPALFLSLYGLFFIATGLNTLGFNTIQGKLVRAQLRGRVMSRGGILGSVVAIIAAWLVLSDWDGSHLSAFILPFTLTGIGMIIAALLAWVIAEPRDLPPPTNENSQEFGLIAQLGDAWRVIRADGNFRRLALCAMAFVSSQFLFPHYVPLAMEHLAPETTNLAIFLIVQNVGVGLFSVLLGTLADRFGNRTTLRVALATCALTPLLAAGFGYGWIPGGDQWYWVTFFVLGMQPVTFRTLTNFTLELTTPDRHPRYLSTMTICLALPFLFSLPIGWLVGRLGYGVVFLTGSLIIGAACALTWFLPEPRRWNRAELLAAPVEEA